MAQIIVLQTEDMAGTPRIRRLDDRIALITGAEPRYLACHT